MKMTFKISVINFMVFSALLLGTEILGQTAYLIKHGRLLPLTGYYVHNNLFEIHPYLAGRPKSSVKVEKNNKTIVTTPFHTRWTGAEQDDHDLVRIATLGGSTTFGTGVTDEDSWPALLQEKLGKQYAVINYGVPGYSTAENIIQMALIVPEKQPHIIVFYEGWNDIRNYHEKDLGSDYYGHGIRQYDNLGIPVLEQQNKLLVLKEIFVIFKFIDKIQKRFLIPAKETNRVFRVPDQFVDKIYIRNLHTLNLLSRNIGAFPIFIPQILNYAKYNGGEGAFRWSRHIKNDSMYALMGQFNNHMNNISLKGKRNHVVLNEVLEEDWLPDDFVDNGHFSRIGGLKFVKIVARFIQNNFDGGSYKENTRQDAALDGNSATLHPRR